MRNHLFEPLGMTDSTFEPTDAPFESGQFLSGGMTRGLGPAGGTLVSTATDMGRFLADHLAIPNGDGCASSRASTRRRRVDARCRRRMDGVARELPCRRRQPGHSGYLAVDDEATCAIAALTNGEQGVNAVSMELDGAAPKPPDQGPPPTDLQQYEGDYRSHIMQVALRS